MAETYTRRQFIHKCISALVMMPVASSICSANAPFEAAEASFVDSDLLAECREVSEHWNRIFTQNPKAYLSDSIFSNNKTDYASIINSDFITNNTVMINGLVLSKTEAALICVYSDMLVSS